jgi:hypothetical protein
VNLPSTPAPTSRRRRLSQGPRRSWNSSPCPPVGRLDLNLSLLPPRNARPARAVRFLDRSSCIYMQPPIARLCSSNSSRTRIASSFPIGIPSCPGLPDLHVGTRYGLCGSWPAGSELSVFLATNRKS